MSLRNLVLGASAAALISGCPSTVVDETGLECTEEVFPGKTNPMIPEVTNECRAADKFIVFKDRVVVIDQQGAIKHSVDAAMVCLQTGSDYSDQKCADSQDVCKEAETAALSELNPQKGDYTKSYFATKSQPTTENSTVDRCCVVQLNFGPNIKGKPPLTEDPLNDCKYLDVVSGELTLGDSAVNACDGASDEAVIKSYCD